MLFGRGYEGKRAMEVKPLDKIVAVGWPHSRSHDKPPSKARLAVVDWTKLEEPLVVYRNSL